MHLFRRKKPAAIIDWAEKVREIDPAAMAAAGDSAYVVSSTDGVRTARYERDGLPDYEAYRRVQNEGNRLKLNHVFASEKVIGLLVRHARRRIRPIRSILCHGTRNGSELEWFAKRVPDAEILGTDIAETATQFPRTIQWDFHDMREDWGGKWDIVYTNSWDHAMEPERAMKAWADSLAPGGILYLEYGKGHDTGNVDRLDLFGASRQALGAMVIAVTGLTALREVQRVFSSRRILLPFQRPLRSDT